MARRVKESGLETFIKKAKGKRTCNSCMKTKECYERRIDGVRYWLCDNCKEDYER
jgi:hypothetical protein